MTAGNGDQELRDALRQLVEQFLGAHLEKHDLEQQALKLARSADQEAVKTALDAEKQRDADHRVAHSAAHDAHEVLHEVTATSHNEQHKAEQRALEAAVISMDKRLDAMNEFRDQLRDQAATFVRRADLEGLEKQTDGKYEELRGLIATEREERRGAEGGRQGASSSIGWIVTAIGAAATILGIVIVVANLLTSKI